jgi:KDO2-lipid IV(A) lauroyltransferase
LTNFATTDSPRQILAWLKDGKALGVLIDTDSHRVRGEFIPAFGRWSYTPIGQTLLGLKTGSAFLPMACLRTPENRYRLVVLPEIEYESTGDRESDVYEITRRCTRALEKIIRDHLDQWPWQHNRWRTKRPVEA